MVEASERDRWTSAATQSHEQSGDRCEGRMDREMLENVFHLEMAILYLSPLGLSRGRLSLGRAAVADGVLIPEKSVVIVLFKRACV